MEHGRNLDLQREQLQILDAKQRLEGNLRELSAEFERYRQTTNDQLVSEQGQREALRVQANELKCRLDQVSGELQ